MMSMTPEQCLAEGKGRMILNYEGSQPANGDEMCTIAEQLVGSTKEIDGRLHELGCVLADEGPLGDMIFTELHYFPVAPDKLS